FTEYWDDFCYPASDDVMIWPISKEQFMKVYAQKQNQPQQQSSPIITRSIARPPAASQVVHPLMGLRRTIGNQAAQRMLQAHAEELEVGSTQPLDPTTRGFMESRFGHDFSQVRVHTDARALESADALRARAYTVGDDIVFSRGAYAPGTE